MLELLSPAGSAEAVIAAVQSGADMVYMGYGITETGRNEEGFSPEELSRCLRYCRVRGCTPVVALNELTTDDTLERAVERAVYAARQGAAALLVRDIGLISVLRRVLPDTPLWGGVRMDIHSVDGARTAAAMGLSRVMLAPELTLEQIAVIARGSPVETAVCVHGPMCVCRMGQCYMSAMGDGHRCDNALHCAEPCRGRFSLGGRMDDRPLSMADACLIDHLDALDRAGVTCAVIGGRSRRPEYVAYVTGLYARALHEGARPTQEERERLRELFAPYGLTDAYLTGRPGPSMLGQSGAKPDRAAERALAEIRKGYMDGELRRVPVSMYAVIQRGRPAMFAAEDARGHRAVFEGYVPPELGRQGITAARVREILYRTGGTPYSCTGVQCAIDPRLDYSDEALEQARKALLSQITARNRRPAPVTVAAPPPPPEPRPRREAPVLTVQVSRREQLTEALARTAPGLLYVPAEFLAAAPDGIAMFRAQGTCIAAVLPRVITDAERPMLRELLAAVRAMGVTDVLIGALGQLPAVLEAGLRPRGDLGLNVANRRAARRLTEAGLRSVTASAELSAEQIRRMADAADVEMIVYGRVPVMLTELSLLRGGVSSGMGDAFGNVYPVAKEFGSRSVIYDARKIFLADRAPLYENAGLWGARLLFTTESARECADVARRYRRQNRYEPNNIGRGSYAKGAL